MLIFGIDLQDLTFRTHTHGRVDCCMLSQYNIKFDECWYFKDEIAFYNSRFALLRNNTCCCVSVFRHCVLWAYEFVCCSHVCSYLHLGTDVTKLCLVSQWKWDAEPVLLTLKWHSDLSQLVDKAMTQSVIGCHLSTSATVTVTSGAKLMCEWCFKHMLNKGSKFRHLTNRHVNLFKGKSEN